MDKCFTIRDKKLNACLQPFFAANAEVAKREILAIARDPRHSFGMFPDDFELVEIGTFDSQKGELKAIFPVVVHCAVADLVVADARSAVHADMAKRYAATRGPQPSRKKMDIEDFGSHTHGQGVKS